MKLEDYGILVGIITAILTGCRFLYLKFKEAQLIYRTKLNNNWTNEGEIGGSPQSHFVHMSLTIDKEDGEITGIIDSRDLISNEEMHLSVNGTIAYKSACLTFTKVSQGRVSNLGEAKISFKGKKLLRWQIIQDYNNFFPKTAELWTTDLSLIE
jgi:hypothetical protein